MDTRLPSKFVHTALAAGIVSLLSGAAGAQPPQFWTITGNTLPDLATNFLGTQINQPLAIKTNSVEAIHIDPGLRTAGPPLVEAPGNVGVLGRLALQNNRTILDFPKGFDGAGFHWLGPLGPTDSDLALGIHRLGASNYEFAFNGPLALNGNRTRVLGFDGAGFHWFGPVGPGALPTSAPDSDLAFGLHRLGASNYEFVVNGPLALNGNRTRVLGFDGAGFHWFGPVGPGALPTSAPDSDLAFGIQRIAASNYNLHVKGAIVILGGGDLSEHFVVRGAADAGSAASPIQAGLVVSIDPDEPGKLVLSSQAYDHKVAGIISGAGGVRPGMLMSQPGSIADGDHPVALTGRVYCWADASYGPITPGDLLTTSDTPGHAMKVSDYAKARGAVLGKAMAALKQGKGLVLVLVSLQ